MGFDLASYGGSSGAMATLSRGQPQPPSYLIRPVSFVANAVPVTPVGATPRWQLKERAAWIRMREPPGGANANG